MHKFEKFITDVWQDESGISSVEYALMLAFMGGAIVIGATALGDSVGDKLTTAAGCVDGVAADCGSL